MYDAGGGKKPGEYGHYWAGCRQVPARCWHLLDNSSPAHLRETCVEGSAEPASRYQALRSAHGDDAK